MKKKNEKMKKKNEKRLTLKKNKQDASGWAFLTVMTGRALPRQWFSPLDCGLLRLRVTVAEDGEPRSSCT
ncbi:hypothetical protein MA16_Dca008200 [Dendrobium catenatum]|uniref:Uncharacterized protein n=1 Tax=Dendrobium catenatum TaxID=906689 RepID=A0A2I0XA69_9ASPA|nr:hypothetical protein MA16_Dca008200 [Dendrobium catenatum]